VELVVARRLPEDPEKRRRQVFKRCYQNMEHWRALQEDRGMDLIITDEKTGEDIYFHDLMVGIDSLPPRQRQAFERICLRGYTETAARDEMLPHSTSSTPVQQYADSGLARMVHAYDLKQIGMWPPTEEPKAPPRKKKKSIRRRIMSVLHPLVRKALETTRQETDDQIADLETKLIDLKAARTQLDELLGQPEQNVAPEPQDLDTQPEPTPVPVGKPNLQEMAKQLAEAGV
jgi:hypothetical protein